MILIPMVMLLTGILMVVAPASCTRKEARGNQEAEKKTRTMGIWLFLAALIWVITAYFLK